MPLVSIGVGPHTLNHTAAASFARMVRDGAPTRTINTSTRSEAQQMSWYVNQGKRGYPKYAAHPRESKHVWRPDDMSDVGARALDVSEGSALWQWMVANGAAYGWTRPLAHEPWHFEYHTSRDTKGDDDMATPREVALAVLGYKNPSDPNGGGNEDVYLHIRRARFAAEEAKAIAKSTEGKIDALIAALAKGGAAIDIDSLASKVADAVGPEVAEDVADELDARNKKRLSQVPDA